MTNRTNTQWYTTTCGTEPKDPSSLTSEQLNSTVTFDQQEGMPTPWQHWEEAMYFLISAFPLHKLTTEATLKYQVRGDLTIVEPHPPEDENESEYLMTTNTKFSLSLNQQNENPDEPLVMTGTGTIYAEVCPKVPLGTVRVKIEMEQNA